MKREYSRQIDYFFAKFFITQANNETGVALCNGVYASESAACSEDSTSCNNTKKKANLAKEVPGTSNKIMIVIITSIPVMTITPNRKQHWQKRPHERR